MLKKLNFLLLTLTLSCVNASNFYNDSITNHLNQQLNGNINNVIFPEFSLENQHKISNKQQLTKKRFRTIKEYKTETLENKQQTNKKQQLTKKIFNITKESKKANKYKNTEEINKINFSLDKNVLCTLIEYLSKPFGFDKKIDEKEELINKISKTNRQKLEQYNIHNKIDVVNILSTRKSNVENLNENKLANNCNYSIEKSIEMSSLSYARYFIMYLLIKNKEDPKGLNTLMLSKTSLNDVEYYISVSILKKIKEMTNLHCAEQSEYLYKEFLKTTKKYILKNDGTVIVFNKQNKKENLLYYSNIEILLRNFGMIIDYVYDEDIKNNNIKNNNNINYMNNKLNYNNVLQSNICNIEIINKKNNIILNNIEKHDSDSESYDINLLKTPEMKLHYYKDQSENEEHINNNQIKDNNVIVNKVIDFEIIKKIDNNIILDNENILNHNNECVLNNNNNNNNNNTNNEFYLALKNTKEKLYKLMDTIKNNSQNNIEEHENKMNVLNNILNNIPKNNYLNYEDNSLEHDYSNLNKKEDDYYL